MESLLPANARRRSDRVSIAFAMEVAGIDLTGQRFSERAQTMTVSRYGCSIPLPRLLKSDQKIDLRRIGTSQSARGRVVAIGSHAEGYVYGIETSSSCEGIWGIRFSSSFYEKLLNNMQDGVYFVNRERKITYWNEGAERLAGYAAEEVRGKHCFENLLAHVDERGRPLCTAGCPLSGVMVDGRPRDSQMYLRHKQGHRIPVRVRVLPMRNNAGDIVGAVGVLSDATARGEIERRVNELEHLAFRDPLTGLANRRHLELKIEQGLQDHRLLGRLYGLLMIDLDRFKQINDTHGHGVGDDLLKAVGKTLGHNLRTVDLVGRWGGEEFLALVPDLDVTEVGDLAERCRVLIAQSSVSIDSARVSVTASIGATLLDHVDCPKSAIRRADQLMYQSKSWGGDHTTMG
jgi:diguanylate cyclase (GGDEF)-like protein/PAS domain S-box-containing protein